MHRSPRDGNPPKCRGSGVIPKHWPRRARLQRGAASAEDVVVIDPKEARRLLDADADAELLSLVTPEEMGLAWCRYATRVVKKELPDDHEWGDDEDGWAAELYFEDPFLTNENFVRGFLVTVADNAPGEVLGWVGAGPIEDFLAGADEERLLWLERQAEKSERFRQALRSVAAWRPAGWVAGPEPGTLVQERLDDDPAVDTIIRRIQSRL